MRDYELVLIAHPELDETGLTALIEKVKTWIVDGGGTVTKTDIWGRRRMAYAINKQREGQYVYFEINTDPKSTREFERNLRFAEPVMRYLLSVIEKP